MRNSQTSVLWPTSLYIALLKLGTHQRHIVHGIQINTPQITVI